MSISSSGPLPSLSVVSGQPVLPRYGPQTVGRIQSEHERGRSQFHLLALLYHAARLLFVRLCPRMADGQKRADSEQNGKGDLHGMPKHGVTFFSLHYHYGEKNIPDSVALGFLIVSIRTLTDRLYW